MAINPDNITTVRVDQLSSDTITLTSLLPHQVGTDLKKATVQELVNLVANVIGASGGVGFLPISVTDGQQLPDVPTDPSFFLCGKGTFLNVNGYPNIICSEELNAIVSLPDHWELAVQIPINAEVGVQSVTGSAVDNTDPSNPVINQNGQTSAVWGEITGNLSDQNDLQNALNLKQNSLGFTPENVENKENTTLDTSETKYPTNRLVKEYADNINLQKVLTAGGRVPEVIQTENVDYTFDASGKYKNIYFQGSFNGFINLNTNTFSVGDEIKFFNLRSIELIFALNNSLPLVNVLYDGVIYEDTSFPIPPLTYCNLVCRALNDYVLTVQTVQSLTFVDAPNDGNSYLRKNKDWFLYVPPTTISYRFISSGSSITGTVGETVVAVATILPNTFKAVDAINIYSIFIKPQSLAIVTLRIKINTIDTLDGATQIAISNFTALNTYTPFIRTFALSNGFLSGFNFNSSIHTDFNPTVTQSLGTPFNTSVTNYLFFTIQLGNIADSVIPNLCRLTN
jgi:hypothetical protein